MMPTAVAGETEYDNNGQVVAEEQNQMPAGHILSLDS